MDARTVFSELALAPHPSDLTKLRQTMGREAELLHFYELHDGGVIDNDQSYAELFSIETILDLRNSGNAGWPLSHLIFGSDGAGEAFGVLLGDDPETYFSTQWVANEDDISTFGSFDKFLRRVSTGDYI